MRNLCGKSPFFQPPVQQADRSRQTDHTGSHQIIAHFHKWKQISDQHDRIIQPIIGKIVNILPATDVRRVFRKKLSCLIKLLPEILREHAVLTDPVHICPEDTVSSGKKPARCHSQNSQYSVRRQSANFLFCITLFHNWNSL